MGSNLGTTFPVQFQQHSRMHRPSIVKTNKLTLCNISLCILMKEILQNNYTWNLCDFFYQELDLTSKGGTGNQKKHIGHQEYYIFHYKMQKKGKVGKHEFITTRVQNFSILWFPITSSQQVKGTNIKKKESKTSLLNNKWKLMTIRVNNIIASCCPQRSISW